MNNTPQTTDLTSVIDALDPVEFGARLQIARMRRGLLLHRASDETGIHFLDIYRIETGLRRVTVEQLAALATAYGVSVDSLVGQSIAVSAATYEVIRELGLRFGLDDSGVVELLVDHLGALEAAALVDAGTDGIEQEDDNGGE